AAAPRCGRGRGRRAAWRYRGGQCERRRAIAVAGRGDGQQVSVRSSDRATRAVVCRSLHPWCDLPIDRLTADVSAGPPTDDGREQASTATAVHDEDAAGAKLGQGRGAQMLGDSLGDAAGAADELLAGNLQQLVQPRREPLTVPARVPEDARVLRTDREDAVEGEDELRMMQSAQVHGEGAREALRITRELVDDAARALAGKQRHPV